MLHHRIEIFVGYMCFVDFLMFNVSLVTRVCDRNAIEHCLRIECYCLRENSMCSEKFTINI